MALDTLVNTWGHKWSLDAMRGLPTPWRHYPYMTSTLYGDTVLAKVNYPHFSQEMTAAKASFY